MVYDLYQKKLNVHKSVLLFAEIVDYTPSQNKPRIRFDKNNNEESRYDKKLKNIEQALYLNHNNLNRNENVYHSIDEIHNKNVSSSLENIHINNNKNVQDIDIENIEVGKSSISNFLKDDKKDSGINDEEHLVHKIYRRGYLFRFQQISRHLKFRNFCFADLS